MKKLYNTIENNLKVGLQVVVKDLRDNTYGVVLDPFAGSGTTGLSAKNLNRNYILIEKEPEYIDIIKERLVN